jgi:hypothetical protein
MFIKNALSSMLLRAKIIKNVLKISSEKEIKVYKTKKGVLTVFNIRLVLG